MFGNEERNEKNLMIILFQIKSNDSSYELKLVFVHVSPGRPC